MCKNNANESVENALRNNGFNECYDGNALEKILTDDECRELWKYIGIPEEYFHNQKIVYGDNIAVYPEVLVILNDVKDPALGLRVRRLRDPSLCSG